MATDNRGRKLPKGIRQRGNTFEGRVSYKNKSYSVHGRTVNEVQNKITELRYKLLKGSVSENSKMSFDDWFSLWLDEYKKPRVKTGTYETYRQYHKSLISPYIGKIPISDISCVDIQFLFNRLAEKGYSASTIKIVSVLSGGCMKRAMLNGMIENNPVSAAILPVLPPPQKRNALTKEQQSLFFEYSKNSRLYNFFAVMLRTGLRSGEIRGLKYSDIDFNENVIHVRRTLKYIDGRGYFEDMPKTRSSLRDIPLTADLTSLLCSKKIPKRKLNEYIFKNRNGNPLGRDSVQDEIDSIVRQINKNGYNFERITPHIFRHTFATRAIEAGMPPQVLKSILGHSSLAMTMDLYSHVMPDTKAFEMEKISHVF